MRISALRLGEIFRYSPYGTIFAIEGDRQLCAAMRRIGYSFAPSPFDFLAPLPSRDLPSLPPAIKNLTLDQALDRVARVFHGVVVLTQCRELNGGHLLWITFANIRARPGTARADPGPIRGRAPDIAADGLRGTGRTATYFDGAFPNHPGAL
jgi:hypothetical protein